jgi:hypothetical protein
MLHEKSNDELKGWLVTRAEAQDQTMVRPLIHDLSALDEEALLKEAKVPVR